MNDEAFLETIRQNPEDDAPRLVYADWLEEQGDIRAEFLRLEVEWARRQRAPVKAPFWRRIEKLRSQIDQNWVAWVERAPRYSVYWSGRLCTLYWTLEEVGQPLRYLVGGFSALSLFKMRGVGRGDYVYPIHVRNRRLYVLARMRVQEIAAPNVLPPGPLEGTRLERACVATSASEIVFGEHGTCLGFDNVLPLEVVTRLRFRSRSRKTERGLKHLRGGELQHSVDLQGIFQITQRTAMDFERVLAGMPFPDLPPEEANLFA